MKTVRHVVAGTDFSAAADEALDVALQLAAATDAALTLVHVCELDVADVDDERLRACDAALAQVVARHRPRVAITGLVRCGRPWVKLDNVATEVGAGLIVVGRHGAGRGPRVEIGSVAAELVRTASRPVLVACSLDHLDLEALTTHRS